MTETPKATTSQDTVHNDVSTETVDTSKQVAATPRISEADYEAIAAAVMETERGRWFLEEYARRNRHSDTKTVLEALNRLEERIAEAPAVKRDDTSVALLSHNVIDLAEAITQVKREVQELGGQGDDADHFNTATEELEAIVTQTETATGEILEAAEKVQEVLWTLREEGANETQCDIIESKIIDIYTACSFQDLTGQRSSKVIRLVSYVEKRVATMMDILGVSADDRPKAAAPKEETAAPAYQEDDAREDAHLLHGPALEGEGNEQNDIDALFDTTDDATETPPETDEGDVPAPEPAVSEYVEPADGETSDDATAGDDEVLTSPEDNTDLDVDIFTDEVVVELHDAEILQMPAEEELLANAVTSVSNAPDIFEVEMLEFEGVDMADRHEANAEADALVDRRVPSGDADFIVKTSDDFAVDTSDADMFVSASPDDDEQSTAGEINADAAAERQDVFDADDLPVDGIESLIHLEITQTQEEAIPLETLLDEELAAQQDGDDATTAETEADIVEMEPLAAANAAIPEAPEEEPVPYTDEERVALFS